MATKEKVVSAVAEPTPSVTPDTTPAPEPANPLEGFKDVRIGGYLQQLTDARMVGDQIVNVPNGRFDFIGSTWIPARRVAGTTNQYDLYLEDEAMTVRVERGSTLQRAYKGEIPNDLAEIVIKLTHVEKRAGLKAQIKVKLNEEEQAEYNATQMAYIEREWDIIVADVVGACVEPIFYDDREDGVEHHPSAKPLIHTLSEPAIRQIRDFLDTELDRLRLYFRPS